MNILNSLFAAPASDWMKFAAFFIGIFLFITAAEKTRSALGWPAEVNRKLVHIGTGLLIFFCAFLFESQIPLIWMAGIFIIVNFMGVQSGKLKGMHGTERKTYGTVYYPLTFLILVLTCWHSHKTILMMSMLILAVSDAAAAIVGGSLKNPRAFVLMRDRKSLEGSAAMFLTTLLLITLVMPRIAYLDNLTFPWWRAVWIGILAAAAAAVLEALSTGGSDNLTAPLGAAYIMSMMIGRSIDVNIQVTQGFFLALIVALLSVRSEFLSPSGGAAAFLLGTLIFGAGGWAWTVPILTFFILSSLLSKLGKKKKDRLDYEKSGCRDIYQVLANGGPAGLAVMLYTFFPDPIWYALYLGAVAAVNADTWATEIGVFSRFKPRCIMNFKKVEHGASGGVTPLGTLSSLAGSALIFLSGWLAAPEAFRQAVGGHMAWIVPGAGLAASLFDSVLGASVQAQHRCKRCGKITEKKVHCGEETGPHSGWRGLNNDGVNALSALFGMACVWIGWMIVH